MTVEERTIMYRKLPPLVLAAALALAAGAPAPASAQSNDAKDTIVLFRGSPLSVDRVIEESLTNGVRFKLGRSNSSYPAADVDKVIHGDAPWEYRRGEEASNAGNYNKAVEEFTRAMDRAGDKKWVVPYSLLGIANAHRLAGRTSDALQAYSRFASEFSDHMLVRKVYENQGEAALAAGDYATALTAFDELAGGRLGPQQQVVGQIGKGRVYVAQDKFADAIATFSAAGDAARDYPQLKALALAGLGQGRVGMQDWRAAIGKFKEAIAVEGCSDEVKAMAWNGIGLAEEGQGNTRASLLAHLRVAILYPNVKLEYIKALNLAADRWEAEGRQDRAQELREEARRGR